MIRVPIYVAGASREARRVHSWCTQLEIAGPLRVTDWWSDGAESWAGKDATHSREAQKAFAQGHERAMREAEIFWLLWPTQPSPGSLYELGYSTALRWHQAGRTPYVVVSGKGSSNTIYTGAADYRDESDELGFHHIVSLASRMVTRGLTVAEARGAK